MGDAAHAARRPAAGGGAGASARRILLNPVLWALIYGGLIAYGIHALLTIPIEGQVLPLSDIAGVRSVIGNGSVETDVRFREGTPATLDLLAVNGAIDRLRGSLPAGIEPLAEIMGNAINEVADYTAEIPADVAPAAVQRIVQGSIATACRSPISKARWAAKCCWGPRATPSRDIRTC